VAFASRSTMRTFTSSRTATLAVPAPATKYTVKSTTATVPACIPSPNRLVNPISKARLAAEVMASPSQPVAVGPAGFVRPVGTLAA